MTKKAIPSVPMNVDHATRQVLLSVKENIETMTGSRGGKLEYLPSNATLAQVITKVNEVIRRIQE